MPTHLLLKPAYLDNVLQVEPTLLPFSADGTYDILVDNCTGFTHTLEGVVLGTAVSITEIESSSGSETLEHPRVKQVIMKLEKISWHKQELCQLVESGESGLLTSEREDLKLVLLDHLSLEGERDEMDLM